AKELGEGALLASLADDTAEGKSIVEYLRQLHDFDEPSSTQYEAIAFSAETRLSGIDFQQRRYRKGAVDAVLAFCGLQRLELPAALAREVERIAQSGGTPLLVCVDTHLLGVIHLKDVVKPGIRERFAELRKLGIRTVMVTGDNPLTAAAIAAEAGVDDVLAEATPEKKLARIRQEQNDGRLVAMCGDGANDAPALAQADVGMAMNDGTQAAREAANMVDLDSDPTKLLDVVQVGKELLVTRGALTTFSIANDVAKYFAILPALFAAIYPQLGVLNLMHLASPQSAILSAIVFNALIIIVLIPLALRGVRVQAASAAHLLRRNLLIYGVGGIIVPFAGIKLIDMLLTALHLV
ncbi:HAD-IC family P-type ATPase, partial [Pseudomonas mosselii]